MRRNRRFLVLMTATAFLLGAAGWTLFHQTPAARADAERDIIALKRVVEDLRQRVDDLEEKLRDREKVIAATSSGVTIKASRVTIDGGFEINLDANTIKLNGGRNAAARVGSKTNEDGEITDGARSVLLP